MTTEELYEEVRAYTLERYPRATKMEVVIGLPDGDKVKLRVPDCAGRTGARSDAAVEEPSAALKKAERRILAAVAQCEDADDNQEPTAEEIAAAHKPRLPGGSDPYLRSLLSSLRKRGYLGGAHRAPGYPLTPKGLAELAPREEDESV